MKASIIPLGTKFFRLTVIGSTRLDRPASICKCDCGKIVTVRNCDLKMGKQKSCGCYNKEQCKTHKKHGHCYERLFRIWCLMRERCRPSNRYWTKNYGDRGVSVCKEWNANYETFRKWALDNGYNDSLSIERIDVNGNYCPENCKWITLRDQSLNKRCTLRVKDSGKEVCLSEYCRKYHLKYHTVYNRIQHGIPIDEAVKEK